MLKKICFFFFAILTFSNLNSQTVVGKYAGEFMAIGVGSRAGALGGAYVAIANNVTAGYWNPAGLSKLEYPQIGLMHEEKFGNLVNYSYGAAALPYGSDMTFGISIIRLAIDGIPDTRNAWQDLNGDGILDITNDGLPDYSKISEFSNADYAMYLSFAKKLSEKFSYGANLKVIRRDIAEYSATGFGFDIGALYSPFENLMLGANIQDVTTTLVSWSTGRNELVTPTAKFGTAYSLKFPFGTLIPLVDLDVRFENRKTASQFNLGAVSFDSHLGIEYNYNNLFAARFGYSDVKQFTMGAGVVLPKLTIDYSFARFSLSEDERLPDSHRISLILTLETPKYKRK